MFLTSGVRMFQREVKNVFNEWDENVSMSEVKMFLTSGVRMFQ